MFHDNTPYRVFKDNELTSLIARQLVLISRKSAVNLARACRSLEEPTLSTLWETQESLCTLLSVLPEKYLWRGNPMRLTLNYVEVCTVGSPSEGLEI